MRLNNCLLAAAVGVALILPSIDAADATPVNYTFSVTAGDGPLAGTTAAGTFSYDTSSIVLNGTNPSVGLLTALNFTWDGITYSQTTVNTGLLHFDATGKLTQSLFGTNCIPGDCAVTFGQEQWRFFFPIVFNYTVQGDESGYYGGTVTETLAVPAPGLSSLPLLGVAVAWLTLAGVRRRQRLA